MTKLVFRFHDGQWQVLLNDAVVLVAKTPGQGAASAASLHAVLLRDGLLGAAEGVELGPGATEEHLREGYAAVKRDELFRARAASKKP
ncbi:MAG: hypothetical protein EOO73_19625 [Myxococcales bacterium]|nr:MAG: hypothetical protein EOO73_19625 [Myxococcales bacterium]